MKKFFTRKRIIYGVIGIVILGIIGNKIFGGGPDLSKILTDTVKKQDLKQTVLATGQVTSSVDLDLSFQSSGVVSSINVSVASKVKAGQILATLDQKDKAAAVTSARGALAQANANYQKVLAGASNEDILVSLTAVAAAETTLSNAKATYNSTAEQQKVLVANAFSTLLNNDLEATAETVFDTSVTLTVSGSYSGSLQGNYKISLIPNGSSSFYYLVTGLETYQGFVTRGVPLPLGAMGLYITFGSSGTLSAVNEWNVPVPNVKSATYVTYLNAYQSALQTQTQTLVTAQNTVNSAETALAQAKASLALKQSAARPQDLAVAEAQVISAQGQMQAAQAALENSIIRSPASGTITSVDIKVGELATAQNPVLVLQDVDNLHLEADISEANIASIKADQTAQVTFDALGPDKTYTAKVQLIDPASTVVSGVVNYKVTFGLEKMPEIKPGMTANLTVLTAEKSQVLVAPARAVINRDGKKFIRIVTDLKTKTYQETEISTGLDGDGGVVEITGGLSEGQDIVTFINTN